MEKYKKTCVIIVCMAVLGMSLGCYGVEKRSKVHEGAAIGAGVGSVIGAGAGHASALGGGPGALVGLSLGATTGALTTGRYYDDPDDLAMEPEELQQMQAALQEKEQELARSEDQKRALMEAHQQMQKEMEALQSDVGDDAKVSSHDRGAYKVTILADVMFRSGSADIASEGRSVLSRAAREIKNQFPDAYIEIRGHTDNVPITHSDWKSNWELSSARAVSVLHHLTDEHGFRQDRIRAVGFADTQPVAGNDSPSGRRRNRRAEIVIMPEGSQAAKELEME